MTKTVEIEVLRPFHRTAKGDLADVGDRFHVDETRAAQLARNALARPVKFDTVSDSKAAADHPNKMAAAPVNKTGPTRKPR